LEQLREAAISHGFPENWHFGNSGDSELGNHRFLGGGNSNMIYFHAGTLGKMFTHFDVHISSWVETTN